MSGEMSGTKVVMTLIGAMLGAPGSNADALPVNHPCPIRTDHDGGILQ
jgi:hypothetical protein